MPRRTLSRYVDNNETRKSAMGRKPVITTDKERELSSRIIRLAEVSKTLRRCVYNFCTENGITNKFSTMSKMA
nr:unnamed protein product [Callosobruchus analis]